MIPRPMPEAPTDGTEILVATDCDQWCIVAFRDGRWYPKADGQFVRLRTTNYDGSWVEPTAWIELPNPRRLSEWY